MYSGPSGSFKPGVSSEIEHSRPAALLAEAAVDQSRDRALG
jgi:hypothetical protein